MMTKFEAVARPVQVEKQAVRKQTLESERNGDVSAEILEEADDRSLEGFPQVRADALVTLCRFHHRQLHQGSYAISVEQAHAGQAEPLLVFLSSTERCIETSFFPQFPAQASGSSEDEMKNLAPHVDSNTCVTKWRGESCDYGMVMDGLLRRDRGY